MSIFVSSSAILPWCANRFVLWNIGYIYSIFQRENRFAHQDKMAEETKIDICIKIWKSGFHTFLDAYNLVYQQPLPSAPFITYYTTYVCSLTHFVIPFPLTSQLFMSVAHWTMDRIFQVFPTLFHLFKKPFSRVTQQSLARSTLFEKNLGLATTPPRHQMIS